MEWDTTSAITIGSEVRARGEANLPMTCWTGRGGDLPPASRQPAHRAPQSEASFILFDVADNRFERLIHHSEDTDETMATLTSSPGLT